MVSKATGEDANQEYCEEIVNNEHFSESAVEHFNQTISSFARQKANKYIGQTISEDVCQVTDEVIDTVQKVKFSIKDFFSK